MIKLVDLICRLASLRHNYVILNIASCLQSCHVSGYSWILVIVLLVLHPAD